MNQQFRIGDRVVIYRIGKYGERLPNGNIRVVFFDGNVNQYGEADVDPYIVNHDKAEKGADCTIWREAYVTAAIWNFMRKDPDYHLMFVDDNDALMGSAVAPESILTHTAAQTLGQADIEVLNRGGIPA